MAKMRRVDSKSALSQQRTNLRRGGRGKVHVGDDAGGAQARAAQRDRVHQMQVHYNEQQASEQRSQFLTELREERRQAETQATEQLRAEHLHEPLTALFAELVSDGFRLARTFAFLPFRVAAALRRQGPRAAEA